MLIAVGVLAVYSEESCIHRCIRRQHRDASWIMGVRDRFRTFGVSVPASPGRNPSGGDGRGMTGWDPIILFVLACLAVIVVGPTDYVSLAGFGIMGAIVVVLLGGRTDLVVPTFALAGAAAVLLGVRTIGMLAGIWDRNTDPAPSDHRPLPNQQDADDTTMEDHIWR